MLVTLSWFHKMARFVEDSWRIVSAVEACKQEYSATAAMTFLMENIDKDTTVPVERVFSPPSPYFSFLSGVMDMNTDKLFNFVFPVGSRLLFVLPPEVDSKTGLELAFIWLNREYENPPIAVAGPNVIGNDKSPSDKRCIYLNSLDALASLKTDRNRECDDARILVLDQVDKWLCSIYSTVPAEFIDSHPSVALQLMYPYTDLPIVYVVRSDSPMAKAESAVFAKVIVERSIEDLTAFKFRLTI